MKNPIILSVNIFDVASNLIDYGVNIAEALNAPLELYDLQYAAKQVTYAPATGPMPGTMEPVYQSHAVDDAKGKLESLCEKVKQRWHLTTCKLHKGTLYSGWADKPDHLMEEVEAQKARMLIIGNLSSYNFINELLGTDETKLAEEAECPVLVVPKDRKYKDLKNIYYLLDREEPIEEVIEEISYLSDLVRPNNGNILMVYVSDNDEQIAKNELAIKQSQIINQVKYANIGAAHVQHLDNVETFDRLITSEIVSMFAFPQRRKSFWERLTDHDNTKHIILKAEIPVLVF